MTIATIAKIERLYMQRQNVYTCKSRTCGNTMRIFFEEVRSHT